MEYAIYNPNNKDVNELPVIYGFNNGDLHGFMHGQLIAQDGTLLGSHLCSDEGFMYGDLGIIQGSRLDRHEHFQKHYPDGYRMDFVSYDDASTHEGLQAAFKANEKLNPKSFDDSQNAKIEITTKGN